MRKIIVLTLLVIISGYIAYGQTKEIDKLSFKLGKWSWQTKGLTKPGDPQMYNGVGYSNIYFVNDSNAIVDEHKIDWEDGTVYKAITYRTFDEATQSYMVVWAQANTGNTSKIKGDWEGINFIEIEEGEDNYGKWKNRLKIFDIKPDSHKAKLERTYASGFKITILEYEATRIE